MNIQEMHLSVQQGVDKIHAQVADTLLSSEIDRELNKAIQQFVTTRFQQNNKYRKGFEESQKRRDDLRTLVREIITDTSFKGEDVAMIGQNLFVDTWALPMDYMYMINALIVIKRLSTCTVIPFTLQDQDPQYYFLMNLNDFVGNNQLGTGGEWVTTITMMSDVGNPEESTNEVLWEWGTGDWSTENEDDDGNPDVTIWPDQGTGDLTLVNDILTNETTFGEVFWEDWQSNSYPGNFIVVVDIDNFPWMNWDSSIGTVTNLVGTSLDEFNVVQTPLLFNSDIIGSKRMPVGVTYLQETQRCRMVQHDDIHAMLDDPFNKTKYSSPLTVMRGNHIDVYTDETFIADAIKLTYIRRPATVDLTIGANCDLPVHTHEEIVKLAVSSILEAISDPRYKSHQFEVDKME